LEEEMVWLTQAQMLMLFERDRTVIKLLSNVIEHKELTADEATGLLKVITDYTYKNINKLNYSL
jgi:hypothetical protein